MKDFHVAEAQPFYFQGGEHGILFIHGFTGSVAHMRPLGEMMHKAGFTVMGINLPGHAQSIEAMARTGQEEWIGAAKQALAELKKSCRWVSVCGLSMGGCISLILAEEEKDITAVVSVSSPMDVQNKLMYLAGPFSMVKKQYKWKSDPNRPKMLERKYDIGYSGFPTRCAVSLNHIIRRAKKGLGNITCPVLAVQSHADESISADSSEIILRKIKSDKKQALWLENVPHVCTISQQKDYIAETMTRFLREISSEMVKKA